MSRNALRLGLWIAVLVLGANYLRRLPGRGVSRPAPSSASSGPIYSLPSGSGAIVTFPEVAQLDPAAGSEDTLVPTANFECIGKLLETAQRISSLDNLLSGKAPLREVFAISPKNTELEFKLTSMVPEAARLEQEIECRGQICRLKFIGADGGRTFQDWQKTMFASGKIRDWVTDLELDPGSRRATFRISESGNEASGDRFLAKVQKEFEMSGALSACPDMSVTLPTITWRIDNGGKISATVPSRHGASHDCAQILVDKFVESIPFQEDLKQAVRTGIPSSVKSK